MEKKIFYSAFKEGDYLATGLNSESKEECAQLVYDFFMEGMDDEDDGEGSSNEIVPIDTVYDRLEGMGVDILEHYELMEDPWGNGFDDDFDHF